MAIAFDAFAETSSIGIPTAITLTVGSIANGVILVGVIAEDPNTPYALIDAVTATGLTFTEILEQAFNPAGTEQLLSIWEAPSGSTSGNVDITIDPSVGADYGIVFACSFANVDQADRLAGTPDDDTYTSGTTYTGSITTDTDNAMLVDFINHQAGSAVLTKHADQTEIAQLNQGTNVVGACSYKLVGAAGVMSMEWTSDTAGTRVVHGKLALKPSDVVAGTLLPRAMKMGIG